MANQSLENTSSCKFNFTTIVTNFLTDVAARKIEIYNEFSLQHELGIYLRNELRGTTYKVQFERNISDFGRISNPVKKEMDICIFNDKTKDRLCAIELKFPRKGQYPEEMYKFIQDISFLEQVKQFLDFKESYSFVVVKNDKIDKGHLFYSGNKYDGIYKYFRHEKDKSPEPIIGPDTIKKPTGDRKEIDSVSIVHSYPPINWVNTNNNEYSFYIVDIQ